MLQSVEPSSLSDRQNAIPSRRKLWMAAIKPPMYSVAIIPIVTGTAIAFYETGEIAWNVFLTFLVAAILIMVWENLCNDLFDSDTGVDKNKAHSIINLTGKKKLIFWIANICLGLGIAGVFLISWWQQDAVVVGLIVLCCLLGYSYQGPPFRFGYQGWGEVICFFCFGPLGISAAYYSQTQTWSGTALAASTIVGITTSLILFCSHFHQGEDDLAAGKRSPIVKLGTAKAAQLLPWIGGSIFVSTFIFVAIGIFPIWTGLILLSLPIFVSLSKFVSEFHNQPERIKNCKFIAVNFHFLSGIFLVLGFVMTRVLAM
jgi:2-carboxy-1,4-naphthoquinone phytyltransferase